ncbi:MAG: 3-hydroxyacyl-[acyl-carrier-protein] dehydratase FabZ [Proteobacteria bacterium]|nr:3-hydroxyacyl-[acyl-carrier-protein] dehydratase FabZ [Pseudomonadota bacterium]
MTKKTTDIQRIMKLIPHRYPFLLIDKVTDIVLNDSAVGIKNVTMNESYFQGHFPEKPIMPGVLIIEAIAQTAAVLVMETLGDGAGRKLVYFMSIEEAKFRKPVLPGDRLELHLKAIKNRGQVWKFEGTGMVDGQRVAEAIITAMITDPD